LLGNLFGVRAQSNTFESNVTTAKIKTTVGDVVDAEWIFRAFSSSDSNGAERLDATIEGINALVAQRKFNILNRVLRDISESTASRLVLLALARATFPFRSKLSTWQPFVIRVDFEFRRRGLESARLLKGLVA
jgi:hypothetical protein